MTDTPQPAAFLDPASRRRVVKLAFPVSYDGREFHEIFIARPSVGEIGAWADSKGETALNIYVDAAGAPIPDAVFQGLDPDDDEEVTRAARDFLPRRLSAALFPSPPTPSASAPPAGEATAPMSEKSSAGRSPS